MFVNFLKKYVMYNFSSFTLKDIKFFSDFVNFTSEIMKQNMKQTDVKVLLYSKNQIKEKDFKHI